MCTSPWLRSSWFTFCIWVYFNNGCLLWLISKYNLNVILYCILSAGFKHAKVTVTATDSPTDAAGGDATAKRRGVFARASLYLARCSDGWTSLLVALSLDRLLRSKGNPTIRRWLYAGCILFCSVDYDWLIRNWLISAIVQPCPSIPSITMHGIHDGYHAGSCLGFFL